MRFEKLALIIVTLGALLVIGSACWVLLMRSKAGTIIYVGDAVLAAEIAHTPKQRERGLSGRSSLATNRAMLFVFDKDAPWRIWMKDMHMPIDIIWLDSAKKVVHIKNDAQPESYPEAFTPPEPARYVLEVAAGVAEAKNIHIGSQARFEADQ